MKEERIEIWIDEAFRSVAFQMALDEILFSSTIETGVARARFYHWDEPAVTVGYFHDFEKHPVDDPDLPVCRRMTGGGLVEHGNDVTFLLAFPAQSHLSRLPGDERYSAIHRALADSLRRFGIPVEMISTPPEASGPCFAAPVPRDLLDPKTGRKIAGGAQRKSRGAVIHQGSIRLAKSHRDPHAPWIEMFLRNLSEKCVPLPETTRTGLLEKAGNLSSEKYASENWNRLAGNLRIN